jgi:hypothetical protein
MSEIKNGFRTKCGMTEANIEQGISNDEEKMGRDDFMKVGNVVREGDHIGSPLLPGQLLPVLGAFVGLCFSLGRSAAGDIATK